MWLAIFADVGVSLLAVMNSIRVLGGNLGYIKEMVMHKMRDVLGTAGHADD